VYRIKGRRKPLAASPAAPGIHWLVEFFPSTPFISPQLFFLPFVFGPQFFKRLRSIDWTQPPASLSFPPHQQDVLLAAYLAARIPLSATAIMPQSPRGPAPPAHEPAGKDPSSTFLAQFSAYDYPRCQALSKGRKALMGNSPEPPQGRPEEDVRAARGFSDVSFATPLAVS